MSKEKKWRRIYKVLMIFFYVVFVPVTVGEWLLSDGSFPFAAIVVGFALPFMRKNHLIQLQNQ